MTSLEGGESASTQTPQGWRLSGAEGGLAHRRGRDWRGGGVSGDRERSGVWGSSLFMSSTRGGSKEDDLD